MDIYTIEAQHIFQDFLKRKNLKVTKERDYILKAVFSIHDHIDAEELLMYFKKNNVAISRATIYRTLDLLVECDLVKKISFDRVTFSYEHTLGHKHHDHLICKKCRKIIEFQSDEIEEMQQKICELHQFKESEHSLRIFGLCNDCQN